MDRVRRWRVVFLCDFDGDKVARFDDVPELYLIQIRRIFNGYIPHDERPER